MNRYDIRLDTLPDGTWNWSVWHEHHSPAELPGPIVKIRAGHTPTLALAMADAHSCVLWHREASR